MVGRNRRRHGTILLRENISTFHADEKTSFYNFSQYFISLGPKKWRE
jgi:hypothetical protein